MLRVLKGKRCEDCQCLHYTSRPVCYDCSTDYNNVVYLYKTRHCRECTKELPNNRYFTHEHCQPVDGLKSEVLSKKKRFYEKHKERILMEQKVRRQQQRSADGQV